MKKIVWLAIAAGAFYAHSRFVFSEGNVNRWMNQQDQMTFEGKEKVCDAFSKDIQVSMVSRSPQGNAAFEGGFDEYCDYTKKAGLMLRATRARLNVGTEVERVVPSGFPWLTATATSRHTTTMAIANMPSITEASEETTVFKRTLSGLQVVRLDVVSESRLNN